MEVQNVTGRTKKAIDAFLVDNIEFESLAAKLSQFNLFRVLKAERVEIRHSNMLGWLLDPKESHGFDERFLRRFISRLLLENDDVPVTISPAQVELMNLDDVEVIREWRNIDVFVKSNLNKFCLLIENKIKSRESLGQLMRYKAAVESEYQNFQVIPILLTLVGDDPSDEGKEAGFVGLSHIHVLELLDTLTSQYSSRLPDDVRVLLTHYIQTLRRLTMQDEELADLCKAIYRKHREAIDLIVQYGVESNVLDVCRETLKNIVEISDAQIARGRVWFIPPEMKGFQKPVLVGWRFLSDRLPIVWWFYYGKKKGKLQLTLEMGQMDNAQQRIALLNSLKDAGFTFGDRGFREEAKFTRIYTITKTLRKDDDGEIDDSDLYIQEMTVTMWKKAWGDTSKIVDVLKQFKW